MKLESPVQPLGRHDRSNSLIAMALLIVLLFDCRTMTSKAKGKMSNLDCQADVGFVKGELDAGVKLTLTVKNVGDAGLINIKPVLSTSEGEWNRSQDLQFGAGDSKNLSYFFDEPTVNARSIQCRVGVSPKAD